MTSVLMVVTAADHWTLVDGTRHPTGFWAVDLDDFDVVYRGGHGLMEDLAVDKQSGDLLTRALGSGKRLYRRRRIPLWPFVVVDRNLYSGQNPASAGPVARRFIADLAAGVSTEGTAA